MATSHHHSGQSSHRGHRLAPFRSGSSQISRRDGIRSTQTAAERFIQARAIRVLPFLLLIVNGSMVVAGALLGLIQPLWFSSLVLVLSNVTIGIGAFQLMKFFRFGRSQRDALRDEAIRRAIESTN